MGCTLNGMEEGAKYGTKCESSTKVINNTIRAHLAVASCHRADISVKVSIYMSVEV
jgi:hypothetical protein